MTAKPASGRQTTAREIRLRAAATSLAMFGFWIVLGIGFGKTWKNSVIDSALISLCSLFAWLIYHVVSRRNDGLIMLAMPGGIFVNKEVVPRLEILFVALLFNFLIATLFGLWNRDRKPQVNSNPLHDPDLDNQV